MLTPVNQMLSTPVNVEVITLLNMAAFKDRLEVAAREKGVSRSQLAKEVGMTRSNMTHWFGGRAKDPGGDALTRAAEFLGVNALWLSTGKGPKRPANGEQAVKPLKVKPDSDHARILMMYDTMPEHLQAIARRQWRDLIEAAAPPSDGNPFGKGKRKPPKKGR